MKNAIYILSLAALILNSCGNNHAKTGNENTDEKQSIASEVVNCKKDTVRLHVETAGTLPSMISETEKYEITDLILTGDLNGTDIRFVQEMAGSNVTNGKLTNLNLADVNIVAGGDGVKYTTSKDSISPFLFSSCDKLEAIILPNSITSIGFGAFTHCTGLTSVAIPNSVTSIDPRAFGNCTGLTSITIPDGVTSIEWKTFGYCTRLTSVTIPNSVVAIGEYAFVRCTGLTNITIPNSVTSIWAGAFDHCIGLTSIIIPNSVTWIGSDAFYHCSGLTDVTIGNGITWIGESAFLGCSGLLEIHSKNPIPPTLGSNSFENQTTCKLYIPKGSLQAYKNAAVWKDFVNIIEE